MLDFNTTSNKLNLIKSQLILHLKYLRFIAFNDSKYDANDSNYYRKFWKIKFLRCSNDKGVYYIMVSDKDKNGYFKKEESLKDPLTNRYIYNYNKCKDDEFDKLENTLLTKFGVTNIDISCNETNSIGEFNFDDRGNVYTKLDKNNLDKYRLKDDCIITISNKKESVNITITKNGYIY